MDQKTYQVWEQSESIDSGAIFEAETAHQAAFFFANERKPIVETALCVKLGDDMRIIVAKPQTVYVVSEPEPEDSPGVA